MYEVEIKAKLKDKQALKRKLESMGAQWSEELHQEDFIFTPSNIAFVSPKGTPVLRVRKENTKAILTLKINQTSRLDCIEREVEVVDADKMIEIISLSGFKKDVKVNKRRIKAKIGEVEVTIDEVEGLGSFVEAEKITEEADPQKRKAIQVELMDFLVSLGIERDDQVVDGKYDIMIYEKYGPNF